MAEIVWEIIEDPGEWHGPPLPKCPTGIKGHRYVFCLEEGQPTITLAEGEVCIGNRCIEDMASFGYEDLYSREIPCTIEFETCGSPGGWHGLTRCDCGWAWVLVPEPQARL